MILQNIVFPKEGICSEVELYYRNIGVPFTSYHNGSLPFHKGQRVAFDTYYNSFSLLKWCKYTQVNNVKLSIYLKGSFKVELIHMTLSDNRALNYKILDEETVESDQEQEFVFDYYTDCPWGLVTFRLEALDEDCIFYRGSYSSEVDSSVVNDIKIGLGICTYKREPYVKNNLKNLKQAVFDNSDSPMKGKVEVFVVDNAQTLDASEIISDTVHLFENRNTGGSGGFTRAILEVINSNDAGAGFTHILLMDDDIIFDPESIFRTFSMLSLLKPEYSDAFVGGAMFRIDKQYLQHASGEYWHGDRCESFITTYNSGRDMRRLLDIAENDNFTDANYQAWWFCAIPISTCRRDNLPLPFFIKSDDIEYSIRNLKHLILLNGINVWHESFESKYSASNEYYTVRNYLITSSVRGVKLSPEDIKRYIRNYYMHYLVNYKYLEIELFFDAVEDFLKGVDYFKSIDLEELHKSLMKRSYKIVNADELPIEFDEGLYWKTLATPEIESKFKHAWHLATINGLLLPSSKVIALGMWGGTDIQTYRTKCIIRYEPGTKKAFIVERNLKKALTSYRRYLRINSMVEQYFVQRRDEFRARFDEFSESNFWDSKL